MIEYSLFQEACVLTAYLVAVPLSAAVLGALLAGILQALFSVQDASIAILGRLGGVSLSLLLFGSQLYEQVVAFSGRVWGAEYWGAF